MDGYISYSGGGRKEWNGFWPILEQLISNRELLERGRCAFLPSRSRYYTDSISSGGNDSHSAPFAQDVANIRLTPENPVARSPFHDVLIYEKIVLPYFPNARLSDVADIAEKETDSFVIFNTNLRKRLREIGNATSADDVKEIGEELQSGAAALAIEARKMAQGKLLRGVEVGLFSVSLGAIIASRGAVFPSGLAGVTGSVTLLDLLKEVTARRQSKLTLAQSEFFVPYLLRQKD